MRHIAVEINTDASTGKALGDTKLAAEGKSDEVEGKIQNAVGGLRDALRDSLKKK